MVMPPLAPRRRPASRPPRPRHTLARHAHARHARAPDARDSFQHPLARARGLLDVGSEPAFAYVSIDGVKVGATPLRRVGAFGGDAPDPSRARRAGVEKHFPWTFSRALECSESSNCHDTLSTRVPPSSRPRSFAESHRRMPSRFVAWSSLAAPAVARHWRWSAHKPPWADTPPTIWCSKTRASRRSISSCRAARRPVRVRDAGSTNGTWLGDHRVTRSCSLREPSFASATPCFVSRPTRKPRPTRS